ncbi:MAG: hypothetical protein WBI07_14495 [Mobilitalea sp.]
MNSISRYNRKTQSFHNVLLLVATVFALHFVLTPLTYNQNVLISTTSASAGSMKRASVSNWLFGISIITQDITGYEILGDMTVNYIISRHLRDSQRPFNRILNAIVLPVIALGELLYLKKRFRIEAVGHTSLIAESRGGHSPPNSYF